MAQEPKKQGSIFQFVLIFALVYLITQMAMRQFFPNRFKTAEQASGIQIASLTPQVKGEHSVILKLTNNTAAPFTLKNRCPMPPVDVAIIGADGKKTQLQTQETAVPCADIPVVASGATAQIDLSPWKYSLFGKYGAYEVTLPYVGTPPEGSELTANFSIYEPGSSTRLFRTFVSKPLLNLLIFIASLLPGYNLGLAIIILTIVVKLVLFIPTQHAMEGQKKMQIIQPKMDEIKRLYKSDPKKQQEETLKIWKQYKVNPMQSCLPMLIQFPILIGLFYTVRDGSVLALSKHLLYPAYAHLTWSFGTWFLGLDLLKPEVYIFPVLLVVMQFLQMKLSFAIAKKKQTKDGKPQKKDGVDQQDIQQKMMLYVLPLMIGFFAIKFPAAVSLYWGISTLFGIGQQIIVNREHITA